jgi:hypothetical protein
MIEQFEIYAIGEVSIEHSAMATQHEGGTDAHLATRG